MGEGCVTRPGSRIRDCSVRQRVRNTLRQGGFSGGGGQINAIFRFARGSAGTDSLASAFNATEDEIISGLTGSSSLLDNGDILVLGGRRRLSSSLNIFVTASLPPHPDDPSRFGPTLCFDPTQGRSNRFFPGGRINTGAFGNTTSALRRIDSVAVANNLFPLGAVTNLESIIEESRRSPVPIPIGNLWTSHRNPVSNQVIARHASGLAFRMTGKGTNIDIPPNFRLPAGGITRQWETCHISIN